MKYLLLLFILTNIFGDDILTSYRLNGITDIEKKMDKELSKEEYWSKVVKEKDTTFGYIESYSNVLACDKTKSKLELYSLDKNKGFKAAMCIAISYAKAFVLAVRATKSVSQFNSTSTPVWSPG